MDARGHHDEGSFPSWKTGKRRLRRGEDERAHSSEHPGFSRSSLFVSPRCARSIPTPSSLLIPPHSRPARPSSDPRGLSLRPRRSISLPFYLAEYSISVSPFSPSAFPLLRWPPSSLSASRSLLSGLHLPAAALCIEETTRFFWRWLFARVRARTSRDASRAFSAARHRFSNPGDAHARRYIRECPPFSLIRACPSFLVPRGELRSKEGREMKENERGR